MGISARNNNGISSFFMTENVWFVIQITANLEPKITEPEAYCCSGRSMQSEAGCRQTKIKNPVDNQGVLVGLRSVADSNRRKWFCRPPPSHSVNRPIIILLSHVSLKPSGSRWLPERFSGWENISGCKDNKFNNYITKHLTAGADTILSRNGN